MEYYFHHPLFIILFAVIIITMMALDLGVFNKKPHLVSTKEALIWTMVWISLAMGFSLIVLQFRGVEKFTDFQSAYWIEQSLSVDNLFVFILVFRFFKLDKKYHHEVLFWGIIGALVLRGIFIFAGVQLIHLTQLPATNFGGLLAHPISINIVMSIFGIILLVAGYKSALQPKAEEGKPKDYNKNIGAKMMRKLFRISSEYDGGHFFTRKNGIKMGTQLLIVLGVIEFTDLLFAIDSIPAIFAITKDPFILYTSNIFAILGLRSLYFLLANFINLFYLLKYGLGVILAFIGIKMLIEPFVVISSAVSLAVVLGVLLLSVLLSLMFKKEKT